MFSKRRIILYLSVVVLALIGTIYQLLLPGLSIAREEPWELEVQVATWLLRINGSTTAATSGLDRRTCALLSTR